MKNKAEASPLPDSMKTSYCPKHKKSRHHRKGFRCICAELEVAWILGQWEAHRVNQGPAFDAMVKALSESKCFWNPNTDLCNARPCKRCSSLRLARESGAGDGKDGGGAL